MKKLVKAFMALGMFALLCVPTITTIEAKQKSEIEIIDSGYYTYQDSYDGSVYIKYWAKLHNPNKKKAISYPKITATARDGDNKILGTSDQTGFTIEANDTIILTSQFETGTTIPSVVDIKAKKPKFTPAKGISSSDFSVENVSTMGGDYNKVTGEVTYNGKKDLSMVAVTAIYKSGETSVYAEATYLEEMTKGDTLPFEINAYAAEMPGYDSVEVYVQSW